MFKILKQFQKIKKNISNYRMLWKWKWKKFYKSQKDMDGCKCMYLEWKIWENNEVMERMRVKTYCTGFLCWVQPKSTWSQRVHLVRYVVWEMNKRWHTNKSIHRSSSACATAKQRTQEEGGGIIQNVSWQP